MMNEKINALMNIIIDAYNNTAHSITNPYFYSFNISYNSNSVDAGIDTNMENYIKEHTKTDIYNQYDWTKSSDGGRTYITIK